MTPPPAPARTASGLRDGLAAPRRLGAAGLVALPAALTVYFSFNAGGFFAGASGTAAAILALALAVRILVADHPFEGIGRTAALVAATLGVYSLWTLLSTSWSDAPGRAIVEFDRALLYTLAFVLTASLARRPGRLAWAVRLLALAIAGVCVCALVTRVAPDLWPVAENVANGRLSYPVSYWNGLGLLAAVGAVLALHVTSDSAEPAWARVAAAAALPLVA